MNEKFCQSYFLPVRYLSLFIFIYISYCSHSWLHSLYKVVSLSTIIIHGYLYVYTCKSYCCNNNNTNIYAENINNNSIEKIKANFNCTWVYYYNHKQIYAKEEKRSSHRIYNTIYSTCNIYCIPYNSWMLEECNVNVRRIKALVPYHSPHIFKWIPFKITINYVAWLQQRFIYIHNFTYYYWEGGKGEPVICILLVAFFRIFWRNLCK